MEKQASNGKPVSPVSRRGLLTKGAGVAAAGLGLVALASDPAQAAAGNPLLLGQVNSADAESTTLASTNAEALRVFNNAATGGIAIRTKGTVAAVVVSGNQQTAVEAEGGPIGVQATGDSYGLIATARTPGGVPLRLFPGSTDGPPTAGTHLIGDIYNDARGRVFLCAQDGAPGTWVQPGFNPVNPFRVVDTRTGGGTPYSSGVPLGPGQQLEVSFSGVGGVVSGATAVTCNLTVTGPTSVSYLTVYPLGTSRPNASNINFVAGQTIANQMTVKLGTGGKVNVYNAGGSVHVVIDLAGFFY